ncbi:MAG TPA: hypothetical protein VL422_02800 [Miltoncostaea sp.]|nr:hypothetical protein [Miltoncostaea sp.]
MRRLLVPTLLACVAVAAVLALGASAAPQGAQRADAAAPTIASLKKTFAALLPATTCDAGKAKRAAALKLRRTALKNLAKATPRQLAAKKAQLQKAIRLLRQAKAACAAQPPAPGPPAPPTPPGPPAPPSPPAPGTTTLTLHVAPGNTTRYTETTETAPHGAIHLDLVNASNLQHFIKIRTMEGQPPLGASQLSAPGGPTSLDITLPPGTYQIYCDNNGHDLLGMKIPFTVS